MKQIFFSQIGPSGILQRFAVSLTKSLRVLKIMDYDRAAGAQKKKEKEATSRA
jgi:hypothetical protein